MIIIEFLKVMFMAIYGFFKAFMDSLPAWFDLYQTLADIKSIFSWEGILQYGFGVPAIIVSIISAIVLGIRVLIWLDKKGYIDK